MKRNLLVKFTNLMFVIFGFAILAFLVSGNITLSAKDLAENQVAPLFVDEEYVGRDYNADFDLLVDNFETVADPAGVERSVSGTIDTDAPYWRVTYDESHGINDDAAIFKAASGVNEAGITFQYIALELRTPGDASINDLSLGFRLDDNHWVLFVPFTELKDADGELISNELTASFQTYVISISDSLEEKTFIGKSGYENAEAGTALVGFHLIADAPTGAHQIEVKRAYFSKNTNPVYAPGNSDYHLLEAGAPNVYWQGSIGSKVTPTVSLSGDSSEYYAEKSATINSLSNGGYAYIVIRTRVTGAANDFNVGYLTDNADFTGDVSENYTTDYVVGKEYPTLSASYKNIVLQLPELTTVYGVVVTAVANSTLEISQVFYTNLEVFPPSNGYPELDVENIRIYDDFNRQQIGALGQWTADDPYATSYGYDYILSYAGVASSSIINGNLVLNADGGLVQYKSHASANSGKLNDNEYRYLVFQYNATETALNNFRFQLSTVNDETIAGGYRYPSSLLAGYGLTSVPNANLEPTYVYRSENYRLLIVDLVASGFGTNVAGIDFYYSGSELLSIDTIFFANKVSEVNPASKAVITDFENNALQGGNQWWASSEGAVPVTVVTEEDGNHALKIDGSGFAQYGFAAPGFGRYISFDIKLEAGSTLNNFRIKASAGQNGDAAWLRNENVFTADGIAITSIPDDGEYHTVVLDLVASGFVLGDPDFRFSLDGGSTVYLDNLAYYSQLERPFETSITLNFEGTIVSDGGSTALYDSSSSWWGYHYGSPTTVEESDENHYLQLNAEGGFAQYKFALKGNGAYLSLDIKLPAGGNLGMFRIGSFNPDEAWVWFNSNNVKDVNGSVIGSDAIADDDVFHTIVVDLAASGLGGGDTFVFADGGSTTLSIDNVTLLNDPNPIVGSYIFDNFDREDIADANKYWWIDAFHLEDGAVRIGNESTNDYDYFAFGSWLLAGVRYLSFDVKLAYASKGYEDFRVQIGGDPGIVLNLSSLTDVYGRPYTLSTDYYTTVTLDLSKYIDITTLDTLKFHINNGAVIIDNLTVGLNKYQVNILPALEAAVKDEFLTLQGPSAVTVYEGNPYDELGVLNSSSTLDMFIVTEISLSGQLVDEVSAPGVYTITYTLLDSVVTRTVTVVALSSINIVSTPTKINYYQGEAFDLTGLNVELVYADGHRAPATNPTVSGYGPSSTGTVAITVSVSGKTTTFNVFVVAITGIEVTTSPTKYTYLVGETLDTTGLVVSIVYADGHRVVVTDYTLAGYESASEGTKTVTVSYDGRTTSFTVVVSPAQTADGGAQGIQAWHILLIIISVVVIGCVVGVIIILKKRH